MTIKIAIGADHRGFSMKEFFKQHSHVDTTKITWVDKGALGPERSDYPVFAQAVALAVQRKSVDAGVLLCGTGAGMAVAANRYKGVYAAVVWNKEIACIIHEDDNINVLVIPADYVTNQEAFGLFESWFQCQFKKDSRYAQRLALLDEP
jgi:ribose 5-phosphate isomerase B